MSNVDNLQEPSHHLRQVNEALTSGMFVHVRKMLNDLPSSDVAHLLESSIPKYRAVLWDLIDEDKEGDILHYLSDEVRNAFMSQMQPHELAAAAEGLETDDLADIFGDLPDSVYAEVTKLLSQRDRARVEAALHYPEDTAGGLMNTDTITVRPEVSLDVVMRYLRLRGELPDTTDNLYVVDRADTLVGVISLGTILVNQPTQQVCNIMNSEIHPIKVDTNASDVASLFERRDIISAPVINEQGQLLGRITIDDVVDVILEEADHSLKGMAGLDEQEDTFAPIFTTARRRAIWLGINLLTAIIAAAVSNQFENVLEQYATLAILMTIVPSMGGVAGIQSLTLVIRGMAQNQINADNRRWLISKELFVGLINGVLWALIIAALVAIWKNDFMIGAIIACAMTINLSVACLAGALVPFALKRLKIDPSLAGGVVLTTITDVVGLMSFLGLATLLLVL
ncbi:MAG: magnesium transporter [Pseudomonadota bacterium]